MQRPAEGRRTTKKWVAERLGISSGHLSSIYTGDFRPSEDLAHRMAALTGGACSAQDILKWHRKRPPVWETRRTESASYGRALVRKRSLRSASAERRRHADATT